MVRNSAHGCTQAASAVSCSKSQFQSFAYKQRIIEEAQHDPQKSAQMASLLAYKDMAHGQKAAMVDRQNAYTSLVLHRLGFYWSTTSWDYDQQMLQAIAAFGFFE